MVAYILAHGNCGISPMEKVQGRAHCEYGMGSGYKGDFLTFAYDLRYKRGLSCVSMYDIGLFFSNNLFKNIASDTK